MSKPLTSEQLSALKAVPLGTMPNKLKIAIAITGCRQGDIAEERRLSPSQVSNAFTGKGVTSVDTAREIAAFFEIPMEALFPGPDVVEDDQPSLFAGANRRAGDERRKVPA